MTVGFCFKTCVNRATLHFDPGGSKLPLGSSRYPNGLFEGGRDGPSAVMASVMVVGGAEGEGGVFGVRLERVGQ